MTVGQKMVQYLPNKIKIILVIQKKYLISACLCEVLFSPNESCHMTVKSF